MLETYHLLIHRISHLLGHQYNDGAPDWLHPVLHIVLFYAPVLLSCIVIYWVAKRVLAGLRAKNAPVRILHTEQIAGMDRNLFWFVYRSSKRQQLVLLGASLLAMPILYGTLELPKQIINIALDSEQFPTTILQYELTQIQLLGILCGLYLAAIFVNGLHKYWLNVFKGRVAERFLRRLRLLIYRRWRSPQTDVKTTDIIPIIVQEVEPIGGFAADILTLPVLQGGTLLTIMLFMFMQEPMLGIAAIAILPIQLILLPRLQRKLNKLARIRIQEVRVLGAELGSQSGEKTNMLFPVKPISHSLRRIETVRQDIHRMKFFIKVINNFLTALTPFFFYALGGYFVIEGRITLGALVAVLAAHKEFSSPLKELFRYYQSLEDVRIRYREVFDYFTKGPVMR